MFLSCGGERQTKLSPLFLLWLAQPLHTGQSSAIIPIVRRLQRGLAALRHSSRDLEMQDLLCLLYCYVHIDISKKIPILYGQNFSLSSQLSIRSKWPRET
ncbi:hypothetical protein XELAEV_18014530mg [Xenopus laevis]|uniref:Uncharacterized protein n=1 Tax=Xenopus laevis TaxID=8355 RepID=A0A974DIM3_XENLA|nr:hypothetical protein XELAEV_18014530mg [Xenopus laevis]